MVIILSQKYWSLLPVNSLRYELILLHRFVTSAVDWPREMTFGTRQNICNVEGIGRTVMNEECLRTWKVSVAAGLVAIAWTGWGKQEWQFRSRYLANASMCGVSTSSCLKRNLTHIYRQICLLSIPGSELWNIWLSRCGVPSVHTFFHTCSISPFTLILLKHFPNFLTCVLFAKKVIFNMSSQYWYLTVCTE